VAFSPDGDRIAVGYEENTNVAVLDSLTLQRLYAVDTKKVNNGNLGIVAWSLDGQILYAAGQYDVSGPNPICRWPNRGRGPFNNVLQIAEQTIITLKPLPEDKLALGSVDAITLVDSSNKVIWSKKSEIADFRGQQDDRGIRLSYTGDVVAFGYKYGGERPASFSVQESILALSSKDLKELKLPIEGSDKGPIVTDWAGRREPKLNGEPLPLEKNEKAISLAISPDFKRFVLGAEWSLYAFSATGNKLWRQDVPSVVWAINITGDGRYAVAGYADGTMRWHRMIDGVEVFALFPHPDGKRWVLWTPKGYYKASTGGESLVGWHVNRGDDQAADFFKISSFRDRFYRPDVIARVLEAGDEDIALRLADAARGTETKTRPVPATLPPTIEILSPAPGTSVDSKRLALFYHARSSTTPITKVEARVDGRPAKVLAEAIPESARGKNEWAAQITIEIPPQDVIAELIAFNEHGPSEPATFFASWTGGADYYKPNLYVLAVGISKHPVEKARLKWAAQDAKDFVGALKNQEGGLYKKVSYRLLSDDKATREEIRRGLHWLNRETNQRDVAFVFLAGHGFRDELGDYYFLPYDGRPDEAVLSSVSDDEFLRFLRKVSGKTAMFLDTCYSGGLHTGKRVTDSLPDTERFANELADAESGVIVFASSTGRQLSREDDAWQNGAFTEALLEGLSGKADYTGDFFLFVSELETYLADRVSKLTNNQQKPVTTKPKAVENYRLLRVIK